MQHPRSKLIRNTSTPEGKAFWEGVEKSAAEVRTWPDWKRAGINVAERREHPRMTPELREKLVLSTEVQSLRDTYRACIKLANETDSKQEDKQLRSDAEEAFKELRAKCPHLHVVTTHPYCPSWGSYDEVTPEDRRCLCCGLDESGCADSDFAKLHNPLGRVSWRGYGNDHEIPATIRKPLEYLMSEIMELFE
jgi:hypothetical protein